jgi:hypothetical protein
MGARDFLHLFKSVKRAGDGWVARCPMHDDQHNSLSIGDGHNGRILLHCHANAGCTYAGITQAVGMILHNGNDSTQREKGTYRPDSEAKAIYDYHDEHGEVLYQVLRFDNPKDFRPRVPDGRGGFERGLPKTVRRVLYRLPELLESERQATVFVVEGEKDADRLASLGLVATTNVGGAGKWRDECNESLKGRRVCILPDNDEAGSKHAASVARSVYNMAESVQIVPLPNLAPKGDVSDWIDAGGTIEQLKAMVEAAPLWELPASENGARDTRIAHFTFTTLDDLLNEPEEETAYVWDRTLPRGGFPICAAKPKVGKSTLARNLAVAVSQGAEFFGRATTQGKVIYLCLEEKRAEVARHFRQMKASGANIIIHTGRTPDNALQALEAAIIEHSPALVIIDPLSRIVRVADFNSYGEVTRGLEPLIDLARSSECHIQAVHHNGKGERDGGDALLGSTGFFGAVDTLLIMKRRERARTLETVQRYGENMPETVVHLDADSGLVSSGGDMQTVMLTERKTAVMDSLGDEPLTEADIKERIGGNQGLISKAVRALHEEGHLDRTGAGKKGDPYRYQKASEPTEKPSDISRFAISEKPRNLETPESGAHEIAEHIAIMEVDGGLSPEEAARQARA